jgi:uncharacterized membrane protein YbhN (UPF0104 family)
MRRILKWLQPVLLVAAALFIALFLRGQWAELRAHPWELNAGWLALSALLMLASWALEIAIWRSLLADAGGALGYIPAARIWFLSAIVRYIPGNVWQPLSMTLQAQRAGVRPEATLTGVALYQVVILLAAAPLAALYFGLSGNWGLLTGFLSGAAPALIALGLAPVLAFILRPDLLAGMLGWLLKKAGRPRLDVRFTRGRLAAVLALAAADWLLWGACFATLVFGIQPFAPGERAALFPHLVAVYPIAYVVGFLSFITPSGFGVREGAFYVLLAPLMGGGVVTVAALAMRVWNLLGEIVMAGLSALGGPLDAPAPVAPRPLAAQPGQEPPG